MKLHKKTCSLILLFLILSIFPLYFQLKNEPNQLDEMDNMPIQSVVLQNYTMTVDAPYNWINASDGIELLLDDDDSSPQSLPFNFTYYNETFSTVYVSSNGYLSFTDTDPTEHLNEDIPSTDHTYLIAPFWDDLNPDRGINTHIYVKNFSTYWVVEWFNISHLSGDYIGTFESILYDNGKIVFNYDNISYHDGYTCGLNLGLDTSYYSSYQNLNASIDDFSIFFTPYPPLNPSIIINNGDLTTNSSLVTLTLYADGADEMRFRNGTNGEWTAWEPYNTTKKVYLAGSTQNTTYTISVKFRNLAGESEAVSDSIIYLTIPLNPSIIINNGDTITNSSLVTLTLYAEVATEMCFRNGTGGAWTAWEPYDTTKQVYLAGSTNNTIYSISAKFRNLAGESELVSDDILFLKEDDDGDGKGAPGPNILMIIIISSSIGGAAVAGIVVYLVIKKRKVD